MNKSEHIVTDEIQLLHGLQWRYATKKFDTEASIDEGKFETLLKALQLSPSSMGLQPYTFFRIKDVGLRQKLMEVSSDQAQVTEASEYIVFTAKTAIDEAYIDAFLKVSAEERGYTTEMLEKRKASLLRFIGKYTPDELFEWCARQAYIAMGQLLTSCAVLRIDACPMEGINKNAYDRILGLEAKNLKSIAAVALGYRSESDSLAHQAKIRMPMDTLIQHIG